MDFHQLSPFTLSLAQAVGINLSLEKFIFWTPDHTVPEVSVRVFNIVSHVREKENDGKAMRFVYTASRRPVCFDLSPKEGQSLKHVSPPNEVDSRPLSKIKYVATATTIIKTGVRGSFAAAGKRQERKAQLGSDSTVSADGSTEDKP